MRKLTYSLAIMENSKDIETKIYVKCLPREDLLHLGCRPDPFCLSLISVILTNMCLRNSLRAATLVKPNEHEKL
jgi:hypothetical protein